MFYINIFNVFTVRLYKLFFSIERVTLYLYWVYNILLDPMSYFSFYLGTYKWSYMKVKSITKSLTPINARIQI